MWLQVSCHTVSSSIIAGLHSLLPPTINFQHEQHLPGPVPAPPHLTASPHDAVPASASAPARLQGQPRPPCAGRLVLQHDLCVLLPPAGLRGPPLHRPLLPAPVQLQPRVQQQQHDQLTLQQALPVITLFILALRRKKNIYRQNGHQSQRSSVTGPASLQPAVMRTNGMSGLVSTPPPRPQSIHSRHHHWPPNSHNPEHPHKLASTLPKRLLTNQYEPSGDEMSTEL